MPQALLYLTTLAGLPSRATVFTIRLPLTVMAEKSAVFMKRTPLQSKTEAISQDMKDAGHATKNAAKDTGHATKSMAKRTGHATKRTSKSAAHKTARKTRQGAEKVEDKTR